MSKWYDTPSDTDGIFISSRVRLARNLQGKNFPARIPDEDSREILKNMYVESHALEKIAGCPVICENVYDMNEENRAELTEKHIISQTLGVSGKASGVMFSEDESSSIMINEDDHLRIQVIKNGFAIDAAYAQANAIDDYFDGKFGYAFDPQYGYLTSSVSECGTGLRASFFVFLPAISIADKIQKLSDEVARYGIGIRGVYGEGSKSEGYVYQLVNTKTLGCSEKEIIDNMSQIMAQVAEQEHKFREYILSSNADEITDKVYRSYGVLAYAKSLTCDDAVMLLSQLKLGIDEGLISFDSNPNVYGLMLVMHPGNIQKIAGLKLGKADRDHFRAGYINKLIRQMKMK
jgi:protein arginine kinase